MDLELGGQNFYVPSRIARETCDKNSQLRLKF